MILDRIASLGAKTASGLDRFGDFSRFCGRTFAWTFAGGLSRRNLRMILPQFYDIGSRSVPVVMITGAFVGMVLAVQTIIQFRAIGYEAALGSIVNLSVVRELGPVLAALMLAGRVGGGLTAELGTMRVTEQIDALRAMGAAPIRVLVVPRFLACTLLIPMLVIYANTLGIFGGYLVSVHVYDVASGQFWAHARESVDIFDILHGLVKSVFFGAAMCLICCYKGFRCAPGAAGVGRACTEAFVASCMTVLALDFFLGMFLNAAYEMFYGVKVIL